MLWLYPTNYPRGVWPIPVPTNIFSLQRSGSLCPSLPTQPPGGQQWDPAKGQGCRMSLPSPMLPWNCPVQGCEGSGCLPHSGQPVPGRSRPAGTGPTDPGRTCGNRHEPKFPRQRNGAGSSLAKGCPGSLFPLGAEGGLAPEGGVTPMWPLLGAAHGGHWAQPSPTAPTRAGFGPVVLPRGATALGTCLDRVTPRSPPAGATTIKVTPRR